MINAVSHGSLPPHYSSYRGVNIKRFGISMEMRCEVMSNQLFWSFLIALILRLHGFISESFKRDTQAARWRALGPCEGASPNHGNPRMVPNSWYTVVQIIGMVYCMYIMNIYHPQTSCPIHIKPTGADKLNPHDHRQIDDPSSTGPKQWKSAGFSKVSC